VTRFHVRRSAKGAEAVNVELVASSPAT
jgi:hypothetical protein